MIVNPKFLELFQAERDLTSAPDGAGCETFGEEYRVLATTPLIDGVVRSFKKYENDPKLLGYLIASVVLIGVRVGRKLPPVERIFVEAEEGLEWSDGKISWKKQ